MKLYNRIFQNNRWESYSIVWKFPKTSLITRISNLNKYDNTKHKRRGEQNVLFLPRRRISLFLRCKRAAAAAPNIQHGVRLVLHLSRNGDTLCLATSLKQLFGFILINSVMFRIRQKSYLSSTSALLPVNVLPDLSELKLYLSFQNNISSSVLFYDVLYVQQFMTVRASQNRFLNVINNISLTITRPFFSLEITLHSSNQNRLVI